MNVEVIELYLRLCPGQRRCPFKGRRIVVLVDEISSSQLAHTIFGRFRDETWSLPLRWIVAGDVEDRGTYLTPPADASMAARSPAPPAPITSTSCSSVSNSGI